MENTLLTTREQIKELLEAYKIKIEATHDFDEQTSECWKQEEKLSQILKTVLTEKENELFCSFWCETQGVMSSFELTYEELCEGYELTRSEADEVLNALIKRRMIIKEDENQINDFGIMFDYRKCSFIPFWKLRKFLDISQSEAIVLLEQLNEIPFVRVLVSYKYDVEPFENWILD